MDEVPDDTAVFVLGDHGLALGEHGYLGRAAPTSHRMSYEIPYLIRHPNGEKSGDDVDWYASTHDIAPTLLSFLGLTIPGKMDGEDLTALFDDVDQEDLPDRPKSITAVGSQIIVRDRRWLVVADRERTVRRMFDDDEEVEDDITRFDNIANEDTEKLTELSVAAATAAGGTLPEFGPDGALRPPREHGDDDTDDDGIPNDFDPFDNERSRGRRDEEGPEVRRADAGGRRASAGGREAMSEAAVERHNPPAEFLYENKWRIFGVMMIGWAMALLDVSIVNISIPELQDEMSTDMANVTWVINAYNIVFAVLLVSMGRLADQFGRRKFFVIGLAVFTIGSALCAAAWSIEWLIVVPRDPGRRRRHPRAARVRDDDPRVPAPAARLRAGADRRRRAGVLGGRAGGRRSADRDRELALDLPHQHPVRHHRDHPGAALVAGDLGPQRGRQAGGRARHAPARRRGAVPDDGAGRGEPVRRRPSALAQPDAGRDPAGGPVLLVGAAGARTR